MRLVRGFALGIASFVAVVNTLSVASNGQAPPYPQDPGPSIIRPEFDNHDSSQPNQTNTGSDSGYSGCSLSGRWIGYVDGKISLGSSIMEITQNGNQLSIGRKNPLQATVSGNRIEFANGDIKSATISSDCNKIDRGNWSDTKLSWVFKRHTAPYCPLSGQWSYTQYQPVSISIGDPNYDKQRFSQPILSKTVQVNEDASGNVTITGVPNFTGTAKAMREDATVLGYIEPSQAGNVYLNGLLKVDESTIEGYVFEGKPNSGNAVNKGSYRMTRQIPCPQN